jgi:hypothetical protein
LLAHREEALSRGPAWHRLHRMLGLLADVILLLGHLVQIDVLVVNLSKHALKLLNTFLVLLILFLLHDKLLHKFFSLHLLFFVLSL